MAFESTGDTGGNSAPIGTELAGNSAPTPAVEPTPIELKDDSFIKAPGIDKPVKYGEHVKGLQSQFTKATQKAAQLERELAQEREARQRFEQERNRAPQESNGQPDVFSALRELPYLSGEQAVEVVQGITQEIRKRDQVLVAALTRMQQMEQRLGGLYETHTNSTWESKINKWVTDLGYGPEAAEVAKEIYLAYEGQDLDQEFPRIFGERMKQLEALFEARKRSQLEQSRRLPFVPGRGGNTGPTNPMNLKPSATSREVADALWGGWNGSDT